MLLRRLIVALAFCIPSSAAVSQPMADRLPPETLLYTAWSPDPALSETRAAKMLADERMMQPWRTVMHRLLLSLPDNLGADGGSLSEHFPRLIIDAAHSEGCFALLDLQQARGELIPRAVLLLDLGSQRADFESHFKPLNARLKEKLGERLRMAKLGNSWLWTNVHHDKAEYTWGFINDTFMLYLGDGAEKFVASLRSRAGSSLKSSPAFADCLSKLPGPSFLTTYIDVKRVLALSQSLLRGSHDDNMLLVVNQWSKITGELGLDNARALIEKTSVEETRFMTHSLLRTDGPPHGLLASFIQPSVDEGMLKAIPRDATFAVAGRIDLAKLYGDVKTAVINIAGEDGKQPFGIVEDVAAGAGVPVNMLLSPLGDQWVLYEASSTGGLYCTGMTLVVDIKDPERMGRVIQTLTQLLVAQAGGQATVSSYEADGAAVQYLQFNGGFSFLSLTTPAWAMVDKKLIVALYPQVVEDAIRQLKARDSVLDQPRFKEALKRSGGGPMFYLSGPQLVRSVYPLALPLFSAIRGMGFTEGPDKSLPIVELLPSQQRLLEYVGTDVVSMRLTADGVLRTKAVENPLLSPLSLTDSIPLWVAVSLPGMSAARTTADRNHSANNLRLIGQGLIKYADENQSKLPPDLATLMRVQEMKPETLQSPFGDGKSPVDYKYLYVAGMTNSVPADVAIAYDQAEFEHGDGANVLYGDARVEWLEHDGVASVLEKSAKWRDDTLGKNK